MRWIMLVWTLMLATGPAIARADTAAQMAALAKEFPTGTYLRVSEHYLMVYDTAHPAADGRIDLLERMYAAFYSKMKAAGFAPQPIGERMVSVLFKDHAAYLQYGQAVDGDDMSGASGYYSPRTNRIAMFNNADNPQFAQLKAQMAALQSQIAEAERRATAAGEAGDTTLAQHLRTARAGAIEKLTAAQNQYQAIAGLNNIAQTLHEATHQLAFNSGIQSRFVLNPFWLSEGLATNFETMNPAVPFGPDEDNRVRRVALSAARRRGHIEPLRAFIALVQPGQIDDEKRTELYGQAWGLFHFLYQTRRDALRSYMRTLASGGAAGKDMIGAFEAAFGSINEVEQDWRRFVRSLD